MKALSILIWVSAVAALSAQEFTTEGEYLWPTDASRYLTSTFGEYRPRRFHTGIDVKTWGKTGYKCFAVRSGYVWRVSVSPYGYGKAVYLKLDTGEIAVYAHLSGFNEEIQSQVEREQLRTGRYRINMYLKPDLLPVAQGDVIAYTGQTGIGAPHLHFEIRDAANRPTNPLLKGYKLPDSVSPIATKVSFSPLDAQSEVNSDYQPVIVAPRWVKPGHYEIDEAISVWGKVGIAVASYDKSLNTSNRYGIYSLKLFVDDKLHFAYQYDRLSFETNAMVELERDYRLSRRNLGRFYKLYKDERNRKSYYQPNRPWAGVLQSVSLTALPSLIAKPGSRAPANPQQVETERLLPGTHAFRLEIADFFANTTTIAGEVQVGSAFDINPVVRETEDGDLSVADVLTYDLQQLTSLDAYVLQRNRWRALPFDWPPPSDSLLEKGGDGTVAEMVEERDRVLFVSKDLYTPLILKIQGRDQFDVNSYPYYYVHSGVVENSPLPEVDVEYDFYDDYLRLDIEAKHILRGTPAVTLYAGRWDQRSVVMHQTSLKNYIGRIELAHLNGTEHPLTIEVESLNGEQHTLYDHFVAEKVKPRTSDRIQSDDNRFWVDFGSSSLYQPIYTRIWIDSTTTLTHYDAVGHIYTVEPKDALMKKGAFVNIQYPDSTRNPEKLGVYYKNRRGSWIFIDNDHDEALNFLSARVLSFEDFTLIRDETPPEVWRLRPVNNARLRNNMPLISASVRDVLSGISSENDVEIRLNGKRVISEYDPERNSLTYKVKEPLPAGEHEVMVLAVDKCMNTTIKTSRFVIE